MTSFRLQLREPYRSVLPNNTCNNLPLGGGVSLRMIILTKQLVTAKSISLNAELFKNLLNGGYHSLFVVPVVSLIHSILQPNLDPEDPNVLFETKAIYFFVLFTYRQVTKSNWIHLTDFGQNVKVLTTTKTLLWYQRTAVLFTYNHGMNPKQLKSSRLHCYSTMEFYSSCFDNHNLITRKN